jgi:hypothetical protein
MKLSRMAGAKLRHSRRFLGGRYWTPWALNLKHVRQYLAALLRIELKGNFLKKLPLTSGRLA